MDSPKELAARIARLERLLESGRYGQLGHSSFEGGGINQYSSDGESLVSRYGAQWDGTGGVAQFTGPPPPTPSWGFDDPADGPAVTPGLRGFMVRWGGEWEPDVAGGVQVAPMNLAHLEVHASTDLDFTGLFFETKRAEIVSARGGEVVISAEPGQEYWFRLVARNSAGQRSIASVPIGPFIALDVADYASGTTIFYGTEEPSTDQADLWLKEVDPGPPPEYELWRYNVEISDWVLLQDQGTAQSLATAIAAQQAAEAKATIFNQPTEPTWSGAADTAVWFDDDDGNKAYRWDGTDFVPRLLGNGAIEPQSLIASDVIATGTVTAGLLEAVLVLANTVIAGDLGGDHTRLDSAGVTAFIIDTDGLPIEVGRYGKTWSVTNPNGVVTAQTDDDGNGYFTSLETLDPDPSFGGVLLSQHMWDKPWGTVAYGRIDASGGTYSTLTNTEIGLAELGFDAVPGRQYALFIEAMEIVNRTVTGGALLRVRATTDGSSPTVTSTMVRQFNTDDDFDGAWNQMAPYFVLYNSPAQTGTMPVRFLLTYASGAGAQGTAIVINFNRYFWVADLGPVVPETGDPNTGGGSAAPTRKNYTYEATATWVRTWNQGGQIIYDDELHQGYGDSFNGIRRSVAGWVGQPNLTLAGTTVSEIAVYMESYHWWNMSGGTLYMGRFAGGTGEPASWQTALDVFTTGFTARVQGKWIVCPSSWKTAALAGNMRGISLTAPSTAATYYGKFRGPANARPRLRIKYTQ